MFMRTFQLFFITAAIILTPITLGATPKKPDLTKKGPTPVVVAKAVSVPSEAMGQAIGTITASQMATLSALVTGHVTHIYFADGATVPKSKLLIQLDNATEKANLNYAQAQLTASKALYKRDLNFVNQPVNSLQVSPISEQTLVNDKANYLKDKATVAIQQAAFEKRAIRAPFAGRTGAAKVHVGDYVKPGDPLVSLVNAEKLSVSFSISENQIQQLHLGQTLELRTPLFPGVVFKAQVNFMAPAVDINTRTLLCEARIAKTHYKLRPGLFVQVAHQRAKSEHSVQVPDQALVPEYPNYVVFRVIKGLAVKTPVTIGIRNNGAVTIKKGLSVGDNVVISGQATLENKQPVTVSANP